MLDHRYIIEPRCRICSHPSCRLIDRILLAPKISKEEVIKAVSALSLRDGVEIPSYQSINRHRDRHLAVGSSLDQIPAPKDWNIGKDEVIVNSEDLNEAMIYSILTMSSTEFTKFSEAMQQHAFDLPPIWTTLSYEKYLMNLVDLSVPSRHNEIRDRFRYQISKLIEGN